MTTARRRAGTRLTPMLVAGLATTATRLGLHHLPPGQQQRWQRVNHGGRPVTLLEGPAVVAGLVGGAVATSGPVRMAAVIAAATTGALGAYDDVAGAREGQAGAKGFRGHLGALRHGRVTAGAVKVVGIGLTGLVCAGLARVDDRQTGRRGWFDALVAGAVVAGTANLVNLMDLRPGRALKVALLAAPAVGGPLAGAVAGAAAAALGDDLGERAMLGDAGANALGAVLGVAVVARRGPRARLAVLIGLTALTAASERVSFSRVIDTTPALAALDRLGRRPAAS